MDDRRQQRLRGEGDDSGDLVLAAVRRAVGHGPPGRAGVPFWTVLEHLGVPRRTKRARAVRARLEELEASGALRRAREHGVPLWALTVAGAERLGGGERPVLPEAPQHLAWRRARTVAGQELTRLQARLQESLAEAETMLRASRSAAEEAPSSDRWLSLALRLRGDCRRLGSAWHCLHEWQEPDDAVADLEPPPASAATWPTELRALRAGRRNVRLWGEPD
jgi:hypothetical protein